MSAAIQIPRKNIKQLLLSIPLTMLSGSTLLLSPHSLAAETATQHYHIQAGSLADALTAFALHNDVTLTVDHHKLQGLKSAGLTGQYGIEAGFNKLLEHSPYIIQKKGTAYVLENRPNPQAVNHSQAVSAASDGTITQLPTLNVAAQSSAETYLVDNVQAGSKTAEKLKDIPRSISTISRQQIEDQGLVDLEDALGQLPGLTISYSTSGWGQNSYSSRGYSINSINIDGARTQTTSAGTATNTGLAQYESVQLVRGPEGLFSGNGGAGGSINLSRKRPGKTLQINQKVSKGSWDNYSGEIDISTPFTDDGRVRGRAVIAYQDTDKFFSNTNRENTTLYSIIEADLFDQTTLSVGASYDKSDGTGQNDPPSFARYSTGEALPVSRSLGYLTGTKRNHEETNVFASLEHQFNPNWKSKLSLNSTHSRADTKISDYHNWYGGVDPITNSGLATYLSYNMLTIADAYAADFYIQGDLNLWGHKNKIIIGADYVRTATKNTSRNRNGTISYDGGDLVTSIEVDWNNFDPSLVDPSPNTPTHYITHRRNEQYGAYLYNSFAVNDKLDIIIGGRLSAYETKYVTDTFLNGFDAEHSYAFTYNKDNNIFSPYYAIQYDLHPNWTSYLSMSKGYEDQSNYFDVNHQALSPTRSTSYELGIKGEHFNGRLNSHISIYRNTREDLGVLLYSDQDYNDQNQGHSCCYGQDGKYKGKGIEFDLSGELLPGLQVNLGYTYDDSKTDYGTDQGQPILSYAPQHTFRAWGRYQFRREWLNNLAIGAGVKAQTDFYNSGTVATWNDDAQDFSGPSVPYEFTEPGRAVWDAFIQYKLSKNWSASLNFNNIFDKVYHQNVGTTSYGTIYGEPRNYLLTLRAKH